jgi:hypothetical protein
MGFIGKPALYGLIPLAGGLEREYILRFSLREGGGNNESMMGVF